MRVMTLLVWALLLALSALGPAHAGLDFTAVSDPNTGIQFTLPSHLNLPPKQTKLGSSWGAKGMKVETFSFPPSESLAAIYNRLKKLKNRRYDHDELSNNSFVLEGMTGNQLKFYVTATKSASAIKGISIEVDTAKTDAYQTVRDHLVQSFQPFPSPSAPSDISGAKLVPAAEATKDQDAVTHAAPSPRPEVVENAALEEGEQAFLFSPDGRVFATGLTSEVTLWDIESGQTLRVIDYPAYFNNVIFSPNGKLLISSHLDGTIHVWDVETGAEEASFRVLVDDDECPCTIHSLWLDQSSQMLVVGAGSHYEPNNSDSVRVPGFARLLDLSGTTEPLTFKFFDSEPGEDISWDVVDARMTEDGKQLLATSGDILRRFDIQTGKPVESVGIHRDYIVTAIVNDHQALAEASATVAHGCPERVLFDLADKHSLEVAAKGCAAATEADFVIPDTIAGSESPLSVQLIEHGSVIRNVQSGTVVSTLKSRHPLAYNALVSKDSQTILGLEKSDSGKSVITLWDTAWLDDQSPPRRIELDVWDVSPGQAADAQSAPSIEDFAAGIAVGRNQKNEVILTSLDDGHLVKRLTVPESENVSSISLSPDGKLLALLVVDPDDDTNWPASFGNAAAILVGLDDGKVRATVKPDQTRSMTMGQIVVPDKFTAFAFSGDGSAFAIGHLDGSAEVWEADGRKRISRLPGSENCENLGSLAFSDDGKLLVGGTRDSDVCFWDVEAGRLVRAFEVLRLAGHSSVPSVAISHDSKLVAAGLSERAYSSGDVGANQGVIIWDVETGKPRLTLRGHQAGIAAVTFSPNDHWIISASYDGTIRYWDRDDGELVATLSTALDGRWLIVTKKGFFAGSPDSDDLLHVVRGFDTFSILQFREQLYRPDLVRQLLNGDPELIYKNAANDLDLEKILDSGPPPEIDPLPGMSPQKAGSTMRVTVRLTDTGGGIGKKIVWRVNGVVWRSGESEAELAVRDDKGFKIASETLPLDPGKKNLIEIVAFNAAGLLASNPLVVPVSPFGTSRAPKMFILAAGVSDYVKPEWKLSFAAEDAKDFAERLKSAAQMYEDVEVRVVPEEQVTKSGLAKVFAELSRKVASSDVFVLFVAGHGRTDRSTGTYYFLQRDLTFDGGQTIMDGIGQDTWLGWLGEIRAQKSVLIFDTCESSSATGITRGTTERETAVDRLRYATGRSIITAATQAAFEGIDDHGILTYALLDAFSGNGDDAPKEVDLYTLAAHVDSLVPELSMSKFGERQRPHNKIEGNFPLGMTGAYVTNDGDVGISSEPTHVLLSYERLRESPTTDAPGERMLDPGYKVTVVEFVRDWAKVARDGRLIGYLPAHAIKDLH